MAKFVSVSLLVLAKAERPDTDIYDITQQTTRNGCECISPCTTSHEIFCYTQLYCQVKNPICKNGLASQIPFSGVGYFDFCTYPAYEPYESKTAAEKEALLWEKVQADKQVAYDYVWPNTTDMFHLDLHISTQAVADVFPRQRNKYMHAWGAVAPIKFVSNNNHSYTGLFKGADFGLIRLGMTLPSIPQDGVWFDGVIAGAAVKLFRDGYPSGNFFAIPSVRQQTCGSNFFKQYFNTHIPEADAGTTSPFTGFAGSKLPQVTMCPTAVGVSNLAYETDTHSEDDVFPWTVELYSPEMEVDIDCNDHPASLAKFAALGGAGTEIFQVWATAAPGGEREMIGTIQLKDALTTSKFGDEQLFFKHQVLEEDFKIHPEWLNMIDPNKVCGLAADIGPIHIGVGTEIPKLSEGCLLCGLLGHKELCGEHDMEQMLDTDAVIFA